MPDSVAIAIADGVVQELNLASTQDEVGLLYTAERQHLPELTLEDLHKKQTHVIVAVRGMTTMLYTRGNVKNRSPLIDVGVLEKVDGGRLNKDRIDELIGAVQAIQDHFCGWNHGDVSLCQEVVNDPLFDLSSLRDDAVFKSVITLRFGFAQLD